MVCTLDLESGGPGFKSQWVHPYELQSYVMHAEDLEYNGICMVVQFLFQLDYYLDLLSLFVLTQQLDFLLVV